MCLLKCKSDGDRRSREAGKEGKKDPKDGLSKRYKYLTGTRKVYGSPLQHLLFEVRWVEPNKSVIDRFLCVCMCGHILFDWQLTAIVT